MAASVAAVAALFAWVAPRSPRPPPSTTTPEVPATSPGTEYIPEPDFTTTSPETSPATTRQVALTSPPTMVRPLPDGCVEAAEVIVRFNETAGESQTSQAAAAAEAYDAMMGVSLDATGGVYTVTVSLSRDFVDLKYIAQGALDQDYADAIDHLNEDIEALRAVCGFR